MGLAAEQELRNAQCKHVIIRQGRNKRILDKGKDWILSLQLSSALDGSARDGRGKAVRQFGLGRQRLVKKKDE
jgi:hypothetical protein